MTQTDALIVWCLTVGGGLVALAVAGVWADRRARTRTLNPASLLRPNRATAPASEWSDRAVQRVMDDLRVERDAEARRNEFTSRLRRTTDEIQMAKAVEDLIASTTVPRRSQS